MRDSFLIVFAYIDPATGAIVLQAMLAAVLALGMGFRKVLLSPISLLFRKRSASAAVETEEADPEFDDD